jgi:hypothetical protein
VIVVKSNAGHACVGGSNEGRRVRWNFEARDKQGPNVVSDGEIQGEVRRAVAAQAPTAERMQEEEAKVASWLGRRLGALMDHEHDDPKMTRLFTPAAFSALVHSALTPGRLGESSLQVRTYRWLGL